MQARIIEIYSRYQQEEPELAVSITARELGIDESTVLFNLASQ